MKESIVTGSSGFIGRRLCENLDTYRSVQHDNIGHTDFKGYDNYYFLSAFGNMAFHTDVDQTVQANVMDLIKVLGDIDFKDGFDSFVFVSTSSVKLKVQTMYSRTKNAAEQILLAYAEKYDAPICIIRPYSVTGPGEQKEHLIPTLIRAAYSGETINFVPEPQHDFIDVRDVVSGILTLSKNHAKGVFELGMGKGYTNQDVRELVEKTTGKQINVNLVPQLRAYDATEWLSMNYKARGYGWTPKISLEQSIKDMVNEYDRT